MLGNSAPFPHQYIYPHESAFSIFYAPTSTPFMFLPAKISAPHQALHKKIESCKRPHQKTHYFCPLPCQCSHKSQSHTIPPPFPTPSPHHAIPPSPTGSLTSSHAGSLTSYPFPCGNKTLLVPSFVQLVFYAALLHGVTNMIMLCIMLPE